MCMVRGDGGVCDSVQTVLPLLLISMMYSVS